MNTISYQDVENTVIVLRGKHVILDGDVAILYQVTTKALNQAVSRNVEKFPDGYVFSVTSSEKLELVTNCDRFNSLKHSTSLPKAFTEKGLYMLATILKSPRATETTLSIIETFSQARELGRIVNKLPQVPENSLQQKSLIEHAGRIIGDLLIQEESMEVTDTETTFEVNLIGLKIKKTVRKRKKT